MWCHFPSGIKTLTVTLKGKDSSASKEQLWKTAQRIASHQGHFSLPKKMSIDCVMSILRTALCRITWGFWWMKSLTWVYSVCFHPGRLTVSCSVSKQCSLQCEGGDCLSLLCPHEAPAQGGQWGAPAEEYTELLEWVHRKPLRISEVWSTLTRKFEWAGLVQHGERPG